MANKIVDFIKNIVNQKQPVKKTRVVKRRPKLSKEEQKKRVEEVVNKLFLDKKYILSTSGGTNITGSEESPKKSYEDLQTLYSESPGAVQCGNVIKNRILGGGFMIEPIDMDGEIDENDEEYQRLKNFMLFPNKEETLEDVWSGWIHNYLVYGNAFMEKVKEKESEFVSEVYNLDTEKMKILVDLDMKKKGVDIAMGYTRSIDGSKKKVVYDLSEIVHLKKPNPNGSLYGEATLENHTGVLSMIIAALTYNVNIFKNQGRGPMQIVLPQDTDEATAQAFKAYYEKEYTGPANAGKTLITFAGAEAKQLGESIKDMDYLNLLNFGKREVAGMFGVPLVLISDPEGSNRAVSIEERKGFDVNLIVPERTKLLRKFNKEVVADGLGITKYQLSIQEIDVEDQGKLTTEAKEALVYGLATPNEAMGYSGWETVEDDWANKKYIISGSTVVPFEEVLNVHAQNQALKEQTTGANGTPKTTQKPKSKKEKEKEKAKKSITLNDIRRAINKKLGY